MTITYCHTHPSMLRLFSKNHILLDARTLASNLLYL